MRATNLAVLYVGVPIAESIVLNGRQLFMSSLCTLVKLSKYQSVNQQDKVCHKFSYQGCRVDIIL